MDVPYVVQNIKNDKVKITSVKSLREYIPSHPNQKIELLAYHENSGYGGGELYLVKSSSLVENDVSIFKSKAKGYEGYFWVRYSNIWSPELAGAIPNDDLSDTEALKKLMYAIPSGGEIIGNGSYLGSNIKIEKNIKFVGGTYIAKMLNDSGQYHIPIFISNGGFDYIKGENVIFSGQYKTGASKEVSDRKFGQIIKFENVKLIEFNNLTLENHVSNWNTKIAPDGHHVAVINNCKNVKIHKLLQKNIRTEGLLVSNFDNYELTNYRQENLDKIWTPLHSFSYLGSKLSVSNLKVSQKGKGSSLNLKADQVVISNTSIEGGAGIDFGSEGNDYDVRYATLNNVSFLNSIYAIYQDNIKKNGLIDLKLNNINTNNSVDRAIRIFRVKNLVVNDSNLTTRNGDNPESYYMNVFLDDFEKATFNRTTLKGSNNILVANKIKSPLYPKSEIYFNDSDLSVNKVNYSYNGKVLKMIDNINSDKKNVINFIKCSNSNVSIGGNNIIGKYSARGFKLQDIKDIDFNKNCKLSVQ